MRFFKVCFIFISAILIASCSEKIESKESVSHSKKDSSQSDYLKGVSHSSKEYLNDCKKLFAEAKKMDSIVMRETEVKTDVANKSMKAFTDYAYYCKNDSLAPVFLIKTAQIAQSVNNIPQAKLVLDKCISDHSNFKNLPAALFLLAQLYDDENSYLNDEVHAKKLYKQIIDEYPKSDLVPSAKGALLQIGKTDAQLIEEFKKKNK